MNFDQSKKKISSSLDPFISARWNMMMKIYMHTDECVTKCLRLFVWLKFKLFSFIASFRRWLFIESRSINFLTDIFTDLKHDNREVSCFHDFCARITPSVHINEWSSKREKWLWIYENCWKEQETLNDTKKLLHVLILWFSFLIPVLGTYIQTSNRGAKENMKLKLIINPRHSKNIIRSSRFNTDSDFYTKRQNKRSRSRNW